MPSIRPQTAVLALALVLVVGLAAGPHLRRTPSAAPTAELGTGVSAAPQAPEPLGGAAYAARLSALAGEPLDAETLAVAARAAAEAESARLSELAAELGSDDWLALFAELERDHPPDRDAVLAAYRAEAERQRSFLESRDLFPWPERPIRILANDNPIFRRYFSLAMYLDGQLAVTLEPPEAADDGGNYLVNHCWVCIPPLVAHEVAPGHHVAYSVADAVLPAGPERIAAHRSHPVFHEGWGLYAESLMLELGYYATPQAQMGAVRLLFLRSLRAWIDADLHRGRLTAEEAVERYRSEAGLQTAAAEIEVARHLKDPGLKASYFVGLQQIRALRRQALDDAADHAKLGAFHRRLLGRPEPIPEIARSRFALPADAPLFQGILPH
ncbi:MAG: DUF885 family protein [Acidobacteriota bacterium]